jgi:tetratricopeptide (TPR) repeat protein
MTPAGRSIADIFRYGVQRHQAGELDQAERAYRQILALQPRQPDTLHVLGVLAYQRGQYQQAVSAIGQAIGLRGDRAAYHSNLALALLGLGHSAEAEQSCRTALRLDPGFYAAHNTLGRILCSVDRVTEAEACYREALRLNPAGHEAYNNLGNLLSGRKCYAEAEACFRTALALKPDQSEVTFNLAGTLREQERHGEAEVAYRDVLRANPNHTEAHYGLANSLFLAGRRREAEAGFRSALRLDPGHAGANYSLGHLLLLTGRMEEGWNYYEWRAELYDVGRRNFAAPLWDGRPTGDRVLFVYAEQGLGDTLQFCRYLPLVAERAKLVVGVQPPLRELISTMPGITRVISTGDALPPFDTHCPLLSLPRVLGVTLATISSTVPYLSTDPRRTASWRDRLARIGGFRVGLVWAGGRRPDQPSAAATDARRSMALDRMAPLAEVEGVSFISLQKGEPATQAAHPPRGMVLHDFTGELDDFAETAALIEGMDLVIGVDTSVPHLAGALGKPVWLLNRFDTCWRWLLDRDDTPWYPTMRLFRQPSAGDWDSVMIAVKKALLLRLGEVSGRGRQSAP